VPTNITAAFGQRLVFWLNIGRDTAL